MKGVRMAASAWRMMFNRLCGAVVLIVALLAWMPVPAVSAVAAPAQQTAAKKKGKTSAAKKGGTQSKSKKGSSTATKKGNAPAAKKGNTTSKKSGSKSSGAVVESRADMQRRQQQTQKEIQLTKEQIAENDRKVKSELATLRALNADISVRSKRVEEIGAQLAALTTSIDTLQTSIEERSKRLERLRADYLLTIKKMRLHRNSTSTLAFIFAASDFNQALRRLRYLKQVSAWRSRQSQQIRVEMGRLSAEKDALARSRTEKDLALREEQTARAALEQQHAQQDAVVVQLKSNGAALQSHLKRKQAEANDLRNRIAAIIAEEQRKAEAAERARKAAEERKQREAEERQRAEETTRQTGAKDEKQAADKRADTKGGKKADQKAKGTSGKDYAEARKRAPRGKESEASKQPAAQPAAPAPAAGASFASQKGALPAPTSGSFRIVSPFGRHELPSLPNVEYDNPGIDAETSAGASAIAVFPGRVSGVYKLPGFNTVVIVNHGQYYTVYGNIGTAAVAVGDQVRTGQSLGRLEPDADADGRTMIHFEVWHNREKQNPAAWLR